MFRTIIYLALIAILFSCEEDTGIMQPVEIRFKNATGIHIDSVSFIINEMQPEYTITNLDIDELTEYQEFDYSYFARVLTIFTGENEITDCQFDLVCCLQEGRYTFEFEIVLNENNEQKASVTSIRDI